MQKTSHTVGAKYPEQLCWTVLLEPGYQDSERIMSSIERRALLRPVDLQFPSPPTVALVQCAASLELQPWGLSHPYNFSFVD